MFSILQSMPENNGEQWPTSNKRQVIGPDFSTEYYKQNSKHRERKDQFAIFWCPEFLWAGLLFPLNLGIESQTGVVVGRRNQRKFQLWPLPFNNYHGMDRQVQPTIRFQYPQVLGGILAYHNNCLSITFLNFNSESTPTPQRKFWMKLYSVGLNWATSLLIWNWRCWLFSLALYFYKSWICPPKGCATTVVISYQLN